MRMQRAHWLFLSLIAVVAFADENCPPRYAYEGYSGTSQWAYLPIKDNECGGVRQSPIDLRGPRAEGDAVSVNYIAGEANVVNSGHDVRVIPTGDAGGITIGGKSYKLKNVHFHVASEHLINGVEAPVEAHFVNEADDGDIAAIGVMFAIGKTDSALTPVFADLPTKVCKSEGPKRIAFDKLLPKKLKRYYTYDGSLTTPPCTQRVVWFVADGLHFNISQASFRELRALGENARPVQHRRANVRRVVAK